MTKTLHYRIACKKCKNDISDNMFCFELRENDMVGGYQYDTLNHLHLNCHWCNDYDIFVGGMNKEKIWDRMREGYGELDGKPPMFTFEWREPR